jgi:hypothetical protein
MYMDQQTFLQRLETLGYYTLPHPHPDSPGYTGLLAIIRKAPVGHQPEIVQIPAYEWSGKSSKVNLHAEMSHQRSYVVCPGKVVVRSRQEREATFFTFGGNLESEQLAGEAVYSLRSTSPILELVQDWETIADLLAEETEILFARTEAQQQLSSEELLDRLVKAGPEDVYLAILQSLLTADRSFDGDFINMLNSERSWYQKIGRWPLFPRDFDELVSEMGDS